MEKWALITGASGGIGSSIAKRLAEKGYCLYLHYNKGEREIGELVMECEARGTYAIPIQANLASVEAIQNMKEQLGRAPDVLVNNAGLTHYGLFTETHINDLETIYHVNVRAPFLLAQMLTPYMIRRGYGRIINISSIWGMTGASCEVLYSTTKGALLSFTKALAKELAPCGITVNAVVPGAVEGRLLNGQFTELELQGIAEEIPMGRLGKPTEIASLVGYLLDDEAGYITGQVISPNGGWYT